MCGGGVGGSQLLWGSHCGVPTEPYPQPSPPPGAVQLPQPFRCGWWCQTGLRWLRPGGVGGWVCKGVCVCGVCVCVCVCVRVERFPAVPPTRWGGSAHAGGCCCTPALPA